MPSIPLPATLPGLTARPLTLDDVAAVFAVIAEQEQHDTGTVEVEEADLLADRRLAHVAVDGG